MTPTDERPERPSLAPHPVLPAHYSRPEERVGYIRSLFDRTAGSYDRINAWMSLNTGERYRRDAMIRAGLRSGQTVLDCASGTGVIAAHAQALVGPDGQVIALDPSVPMLAEAVGRGVRQPVAAIAERLPLPDDSVDLVAIGYALRHVADLGIAFAELARVLRPGGRLLILEMVPPTSRVGYLMAKLYLKHLVPALAFVVTRRADARRLMRYYWDTVSQCVPPDTVMAALAEAGFIDVRRDVLFALLSEYTASLPAATSVDH
ncbi:MAG: class I SAM-dependent methyltransferase [Thiohalocapsa sp.]|jgi:demethylmenaquinone methyltransferase/2-methoxy-6-polyprenyl-1,4-benzoquinol methylase